MADHTYALDSALIESCIAMNGVIKRHDMSSPRNKDPDIFMEDLRKETVILLKSTLRTEGALKFSLCLQSKLERTPIEGPDKIVSSFITSPTQQLLQPFQIDALVSECFKKIMEAFVKSEKEGSGWILLHCQKLRLRIARYKPLKGGSYIQLPKALSVKKACLNIKNEDEKCFIWSVLAGLHPVSWKDHNNRVSNYIPFEDELNMNGILLPMEIPDIPKFELMNKISINVFGYESQKIFPLYITSQRYDKHINLLLLKKNNTDGETISHYVLVKSLSRLLHKESKHKAKKYPCNYCLQCFTTKRILDKHVPYCEPHGPQRIEMPERKNRWIKFTKYHKQMEVPWVVYAGNIKQNKRTDRF